MRESRPAVRDRSPAAGYAPETSFGAVAAALERHRPPASCAHAGRLRVGMDRSPEPGSVVSEPGSVGLEPVGAGAAVDLDGDYQVDCGGHFGLDQGDGGFQFGLGDFEQQFVVDLEQHLGA